MLDVRAVVVIPALLAFSAGGSIAAETQASFAVELEGKVHDQEGRPLVGAVVSVFGKNLADGARTAVTDESGEFQVDEVPPGIYRLRAYLSGFLPSAYAQVIIEEGVERVGSILMSLAQVDEASATTEEGDSERTLAELRWLLQHGDRNILKDEEWLVPPEPVRTASLESREASPGLFDIESAIRGEFGVRAAAYDQGLDEFPGAGAGLDARLAYARLFIPTDDNGHWLVSAQLLESALASWAGRAEYASGDTGGHRLAAGVTYGNYLYGDLEDFRPPDAALSFRPTGERSTEWFGSAYVSDSFLLGKASVDAGLAYEYFGFLDRSGYASPSARVSYPVGDEEDTIVRGSVNYRVLAPGGEDIGLLSQMAYSDVYGPSLARTNALRAERTVRFQLGVERRLDESTRVAVRMFQENAADQLLKIYTKAQLAGTGAGHFTVGNHGDFRTRGVGLSVFRSFGAMEGSVGYTFGMGRPMSPRFQDMSDEEIHDVTTTVATSIDRTRTRLEAAYRVTSHPAFAPTEGGFGPGTNLDSRYNIQVFQLLPFVGWNGTSWELMVAVRNLFYEDIDSASVLDEIAVIEAPRRVLGGVTVRF